MCIRYILVPREKKNVLIGHAVNIIILLAARKIECRPGLKGLKW